MTVRKIAFVSGKGGVGKTLLASNFARLASTRFACALVDLDFQNQGSSGLLAEYLVSGCLNAFDIISSGTADFSRAIEVRPQLFFIPAFDPHTVDRFRLQDDPSFRAHALGAVQTVFRALINSNRVDVIVVDCHGGLDDVSFGAFIESDHTLIVTEPDKVTFNGTLELIDFYCDRAENLTGRPSGGIRLSLEGNPVSIVVNSVSGKYSYAGLQDLLSRQFYQNIPELKEINKGFLFIPADPIVAESFSEYPFFSELLPEAIFTQKLELLHVEVLGAPALIKGRSIFFKLFERLSSRAIKRRMISAYEKRVQTVFSFVGVAQVAIAAWFAGFFSLYITKDNPLEVYLELTRSRPFEEISIGFLALSFAYLTLFYARIAGYYRDQWRYEYRLWRHKSRRLSLAFVIKLITVIAFRFFPVLFGAFSALYAVGFFVVFVLYLLGVK